MHNIILLYTYFVLVKWTALWSKHQNQAQMRELNCLQKINHFPDSWCVGRKDRLLLTMNAMKRLHGRCFDFHPDGFILPQERDALLRLLQAETKTKKGNTSLWIMKPVASAQGKGIRVSTLYA